VPGSLVAGAAFRVWRQEPGATARLVRPVGDAKQVTRGRREQMTGERQDQMTGGRRGACSALQTSFAANSPSPAAQDLAVPSRGVQRCRRRRFGFGARAPVVLSRRDSAAVCVAGWFLQKTRYVDGMSTPVVRALTP
jgi:hypothetical protein